VNIGNAAIREGDAKSRTVMVPVTLSRASTSSITVPFRTVARTAKSGVDYTAANRTVTFPAGTTTVQVPVTILADSTTEPTETFAVMLSAPSVGILGDGDGVVTILNDDPAASAAQLAVSDVTVHEGDGGKTTVAFAITLSKTSTSAVTFDYTTVNGTAVAGADYTLAAKRITISAGLVSATVSVTVIGDDVFEPDQSFKLQISNIAGATAAKVTGTATILDDD
jgi:hypothetical protein